MAPEDTEFDHGTDEGIHACTVATRGDDGDFHCDDGCCLMDVKTKKGFKNFTV